MKRFIHQYITGKPFWVNLLWALGFVILIIVLFAWSLNWITHHGVALTVPSVTGKKLGDVEKMLDDKGFSVVIQDSVYYDSLPPTTIIKQVPEADAVVKVNRTIYVTINRTVPPDVDMPNLLGYSLSNVLTTLKNLGLQLGDTTYKPDVARNRVLEQLYNGSPIAQGTKIKAGSKISFVLGNGVGSESMNVPDLLGMTYEQAKAMLQTQRLVLASIIPTPEVRDTLRAYVVRQEPQVKDNQGHLFKIRPGQMMDIWLDVNPPKKDTVPVPIISPPTTPPSATDPQQ